MPNGSNWKETNRSFFWQSHGSRTIAEQQIDIQNLGTMNNNFIADFAQSPFHWTSYSVDGAFPVKLAAWRTFSGKDLNSVSFPATAPEFQHNATGAPMTYTFKGRRKVDYRGNVYDNSATIPAYYANIFFDNGPALGVDAGQDIIVTPPSDSTSVRAVATGPVARYNWTKISGPSQFTIVTPTASNTVIKGLVSGSYAFRIEVADSRGITAADTVLINVSIVLPVTLVEFTAKRILDNRNLVSWRTATELNSSYYSVERSGDGRTFQEIGRVNSNNRSTDVSQYSFSDNQPLFGANYYRLRMVDRDGSFRHSNIVLVGRKTTGSIIIDNLALNSSSGTMTLGLTTNRAQRITYSIVSSNGILLSNNNVQLQPGYNRFLSNASFSAGVYYVRVVSEDETLIRSVLAQ
jgi:hypothetical protein